MKLSSLIFLFIITISINTQAQVSLDEHKWYKLKLPTFLHGQKGFVEYIMHNVRMPYKESKTEITGEWRGNFILTKNNNLILKNVEDSTNSDELNTNIKEWLLLSSRQWTVASINSEKIDFPIKLIVKISTDQSTNFFSTAYIYIFSPELANQYYNEGVRMFESQNFSEAIKFFDETILLTSKDIDALYNRGICKFKTGDKAGACEDWQKINSLGKPDADNLITKYCN